MLILQKIQENKKKLEEIKNLKEKKFLEKLKLGNITLTGEANKTCTLTK